MGRAFSKVPGSCELHLPRKKALPMGFFDFWDYALLVPSKATCFSRKCLDGTSIYTTIRRLCTIVYPVSTYTESVRPSAELFPFALNLPVYPLNYFLFAMNLLVISLNSSCSFFNSTFSYG